MEAPLALALVLVPLLCGTFLRVPGAAPGRWVTALPVAASTASFAVVAFLAAGTLGLAGPGLGLGPGPGAPVDGSVPGDLSRSFSLGSWVPGLGLDWSWRIDSLTLLLALLVSGVGTLVLHYAGVYFGPTTKGRRALSWLLAFEASMLGLVLADDALLFFVFWELTGICSYFLIQLEADKSPGAEGAARQALLVTVLGGLPLLVGLLYLQSLTGDFRMSAWALSALEPGQTDLAFVLVLLGAAAKSAQVPFHFWLPGAMAAPSPISAYLHSATMVKAGIILLILLFPVLGGATLWSPLLLALGFLTCVWGAYRALAENDIKKLMAWSTVSQLGLLVLTLGLGTELAVRAALLHLVVHGVFKAALFLVVGSVDKAAGTRNLDGLGGLARREPILAVAAIVAAGSMAGLPPLAGFLSKELVLKKTMLADPMVHVPALLGIVIGSIGTVAYSYRFVRGVFFGRPKSGEANPARSGAALSPGLVVGPVILSGLLLFAGLAAPIVDRFLLEPASLALLGHDLEPPALKLWHGVNKPLLFSLGILTLGLGLEARLRGRLVSVPETSFSPQRIYAASMERAADLGELLDRGLTRLDPRVYVGSLVVLGFVTAAFVPFLHREFPVIDWSAAPGGGESVLAPISILVVGIALLRSTTAVSQIVLTSILGFAVALLFYGLRAPDLVMTQILVELLITAVLLLGLRPWSRWDRDADWWGRSIGSRGDESAEPGGGRFLRHLAAGAAAAGAASFVLLAAGRGDAGWMKPAFAWLGPTLGEGKNLVNVILVDFRGLDTLVETLVVLLAGLGAVGVLLGRERETAPVPTGAVRQSGPLLRTAGRFLVPLGGLFSAALLLQGHDDSGGGFVASLCLVLTLLLYIVMKGSDARPGLPRWAGRTGWVGAAGLVAFVALPLLWGEPALRQAGVKLGEGAWSMKFHSSLLFDLGVVAIVGGGVLASLLGLMAGRTR